MHDVDAIVVGAGIGGLTAAVALQRSGHRVRVLDQTRELRAVGAGISLWSNGVKVLNALGLGPEIAAVGGIMDRLAYHGKDGRLLCDFSLGPLVDRVGQRPYPVRRSDLQDLLVRAVGDHISLGQRCVAIEQDADTVTVTTEAGDRLVAELVVIADGTHSRLRSHVVDVPVERSYVGYHNWNGLVPNDLALGEAQAWTVHVGDGQRVSTMPVRDAQYFFFDIPLLDPVVTADDVRAVLRRHFTGWDDAVQRLIEGLDPAGVATTAIHSHAPLTDFARGRVVLVGDAAHTTAPDLGQGGCMAMEDALVLTNYLTTTNIGVADALTRYSAERVPRAAEVIRRATKRAQLSHGHDPQLTDAWYRELADEDGTRILDGIGETIVTGPFR